jgi:hypothetical protein
MGVIVSIDETEESAIAKYFGLDTFIKITDADDWHFYKRPNEFNIFSFLKKFSFSK